MLGEDAFDILIEGCRHLSSSSLAFEFDFSWTYASTFSFPKGCRVLPRFAEDEDAFDFQLT